MPRKYKLEEVRALCEERGITLIEKVYPGAHVPLKCLCVCGKPMEKNLSNILRGQLCRECGYKNRDVGKLDYSYVKATFEKEGYELIASEYIGTKIPIEYKCPVGHIGKIAFYNFEKMGQRCRKCYLENNYGKNHPRYKPELTDEYRMSKRNSTALRQWYYDIKLRDDFTCAICGDDRGGNLNAHHFYSYADYPDKRLDMNNGITLCKTCHLEFHGEYGYGKNDIHQFIDFMITKGITEVPL